MSNIEYKKIDSLSEIPNINYEGYVWLSDKDKPCKVNNETYDFNSTAVNPFIVEANLYACDKSISVSIRNVNGSYHIGIVDWALVDQNKVNTSDEKFVTHKIKDEASMYFTQAWTNEEDDCCEGMEVLTPAWKAFVGFNNNRKGLKK